MTCLTCGLSIRDKAPNFVATEGWDKHYFCPMPSKEQIKRWEHKKLVAKRVKSR